MDAQRLRTLTTGRLHTSMPHVYADIEELIGEEGLMTHQIPAAMRAIRLYLKGKVPEERFWNGEFDTSHTGDYLVPVMNDAERETFFDAFEEEQTKFWEQTR